MALETGTYISDLVSTNPAASDNISQGDDHIRLLKSTIKATFPNVSGAVTPTHTELNYVDGVTSSIQTQLDGKQAAGSYAAATHTHTSSDITDSTTAGRNLLTAADAAAQRTSLGLGSAATLTAGTSANNLVQLNGSAQLPAVSGALLTNLPPQVNVQKFTSSGTWTKPANATSVLVRLWGAGGGGSSGGIPASGAVTGATGGGAGAYIEYLFAADSLSSTQSVTIGAGGAGAAASTSTGAYGSDGGSSSFSFLTAPGGSSYGTGGVSPDSLHASINSNSYWNGGSGGNGTASGNSSYKAAGGGGSGGGIASNGLWLQPYSGGSFGSFNAGGGGSPGVSDPNSPTAGSNGGMFKGGGGGGSATAAAAAGKGGNGGIAAGGGGGGANRSGSGRSNGAGGTGGNGYAEIITW